MSVDSELKRCLQALAQPAEVQKSLFPEFAAVGDELALEFDDAVRMFRAQCPDVRREQSNAVDAVDQYLEACSKNQTESFWCDSDQLDSATEWQHVRMLAALALSAFGWDSNPPPRNAAIYVGKSETVRNTYTSEVLEQSNTRRTDNLHTKSVIVCTSVNLCARFLTPAGRSERDQ